ncbi:MAG: hypothetical protein GEU90_15530 [Gemmatimonas sp.]|nr:hypothetical protein [Gemmatimonas sp.]
MATDTQAMLEQMRTARGYLYPSHELAAELDPQFMEVFNRLAGLSLLHEGVDSSDAALDTKQRELIVIGILAARGGSAVSHMRRAIRFGATEKEIFEVGKAAMVPAGAPAFLSVVNGLLQLRADAEAVS